MGPQRSYVHAAFMLLFASMVFDGVGIGLHFSLCWHLWVVVLQFSFAWAHSSPTVLRAVLPFVQSSTPACHVWGWAAFHKPLLRQRDSKALWLMAWPCSCCRWGVNRPMSGPCCARLILYPAVRSTCRGARQLPLSQALRHPPRGASLGSLLMPCLAQTPGRCSITRTACRALTSECSSSREAARLPA